MAIIVPSNKLCLSKNVADSFPVDSQPGISTIQTWCSLLCISLVSKNAGFSRSQNIFSLTRLSAGLSSPTEKQCKALRRTVFHGGPEFRAMQKSMVRRLCGLEELFVCIRCAYISTAFDDEGVA